MMRLKDLSVQRKFMLISGVFLIGLIVIIIMFMANLRKTMYKEKQESTRVLVETVYGVVQHYYQYEIDGVMVREEAQRQAINMIKKLRYDEKEYFWLNDMQPKMIMHPYKPELDGQDLSTYADPQGKKLFIEFVEMVKKNKAGFVYYLWPKPGFDQPVEKVSYVKGFEPWGWIVGSGIYLDSVMEEFWQQLTAYTGVSLFLILISSLLLWITSQNINEPVKEIHDKVEQISNGDLTVMVNVNQLDELGLLAANFNKMVDELRGIILSLRQSVVQLTAVEEASDALGNKVHEGSEKQHENVRNILAIFDNMERKLDDLRGKVGKLSNSIESTAASILEVSASSTEIMGAMDNLSMRTHNLSDANSKMSNINSKIDEGADTLMQKVENLRSFSTELDSAVKSTLGIVNETSAIAKEMNGLAHDSKSSISESITNIDRIADMTVETKESFLMLKKNIGKISSILTVIEEITDKTNMLALNAAIIAAQKEKGGEAFSVVAQEIKNLSQMTQSSTKEIGDLIDSITAQTEKVFSKVQSSATDTENAVTHFKGVDVKVTAIIGLIDKVALGVQEIVTAAKEQSRGSEIIKKEIEDLQKVSQTLSSIRVEGSEAGKAQRETVDEISITVDKVGRAVREQTEALENVRMLVVELSEFASGLLDHFKLELEEMNKAKPVLDEINVQADENTASAEDLKRKFLELKQLIQSFDEISGRFRVSEEATEEA